MTTVKPGAVLVACLLATGALAQAPDPQAPPTFPAQAEVVVVDVVVTGKDGGPVPGLRHEDFAVSEDGSPQPVVSFEEVDVAGSPAGVVSEQPMPRVSVNTGLPAMSARSFVLVLDEVHMSAVGAHRAKAAAAAFLRFGPREGDTVMLLSTAGGSWWMTRTEEGKNELSEVLKRLKGPYQVNDTPDRITDWEAMRIWEDRDAITLEQVRRRFEAYMTGKQQMAEGTPVRGIDRLTEGKSFVPDDEIRGRAQDVYQQAVVRNRTTLSALVRVLDGLGGVRGRKTVILFSEGFIRDPRLEGYDGVIRAAQRTNTAVYFVDVRGLSAMPLAATAQFGPMLPGEDVSTTITQDLVSSEGADTIANNTGGFPIKNTNDLERGLRRIAQETRRYYLLGYSPSNSRPDGKWRKIGVQVRGPGVEVRARKGYFAPENGKKGGDRGPSPWRPGLQQAIDSPYEFNGIPLRLTHHVFGEKAPGKARALVTAEVDVRRLAFEDIGGRSVDTLEFLFVVTHRETGEFQRRDESLDLKLPPDVRASMERSWLRKSQEFEFLPGGYLAKLVVRDKGNGTIGSITHEFEVSDLRQWHTSTPILSDALEPKTEGQALRPVIPARRSFMAGSTLYYQFEVYGSLPDPASGLPRVSAGFSVRASDGAAVTRGEPALIRPAGQGRLARIGVVSLEGMAAGRYDLVLDIEDQVAGRRLEVTEPFEVEPRSGG